MSWSSRLPVWRFWLAQAIEGAAGRLHRPECRRVFSDFKDASVQVEDRSVTEPGSRVVFFCGRHFEQRSRGFELQIIHVILHSLGRGENPPSSDQITRQVAARCGVTDSRIP